MRYNRKNLLVIKKLCMMRPNHEIIVNGRGYIWCVYNGPFVCYDRSGRFRTWCGKSDWMTIFV